MTKRDLAKIYVKNGYASSTEKGVAAIDHFIDVITEAIRTGEKITIHGFLSFEPTERKARYFINNLTNQESFLPAATVLKITQTEKFKEAIDTQDDT